MQFFKTHTALCTAVIPSWPDLPLTQRQQIRADVTLFLADECAMLPWFIAIPLNIMQNLFMVSAWCSQSGTAFQVQTDVQQQRFMRHWYRLGAPFQALIRLYRSLVMLAYMEHPLVRIALHLPDQIQHQSAARAKRQILLQRGALNVHQR